MNLHILLRRRFATALLWLCLCPLADADEFILPPDDVDLVGRLRRVEARQEDTLLDIARRNDLGRDEIVAANPGVDPWLPGKGRKVLLPTRFILPPGPRTGLVLNLPEMRLYYYLPGRGGQPGRVITHPVAIGRMDWQTPLGETRIVAKQKDPAWRPPASLKQEALAKGLTLPDVVPPGPDNPLGTRALRLGLPGYLMHGTNKPYGVGMRVSHGCIRLYPEDIETLYDQVPVGTPVRILDEPVKLGWLAGTLFIEVHPPLEEEAGRDLRREALERIYAELGRHPARLDGAALKRALKERRGIPIPITKD